MPHPTNDPLASWPDFMEQVRQRMAKGRCVYGDLSFRASPAKLQGEVLEELLDVAGWAYVLWARVKGLEEYLHRQEHLEDRCAKLQEEVEQLLRHPSVLVTLSPRPSPEEAHP